MGWVNLWWSQPEHYERLSAHLELRGMKTLARATVAVIAGGLALVALGMMLTPVGPVTPTQRTLAVTAAIGAAGGALLWTFRWPRRRTAIAFVLVSDACIALACVSQSDPVVAMLTVTAFATLAAYIAIFHRAWLMLLNFQVATAVAGLEGFRIAHFLGVMAAVCGVVLVLLLNLAIPFGIQTVVHVLGADAVHAERDELTGLLTRRAFHRQAKARLVEAAGRQAHAVVTVIDLDRFKRLNDTYGHSTGDDALVSVARALRDSTDDSAIIGRVGGEEFVVADIWHPDDVDRKAHNLCDVIAALPFGITASIGTAGLYPAYRTGSVHAVLLELIVAADAAMYCAKREGGNRVLHHQWPLPPPLSTPAEEETGFRNDGISA